MTLYRYAGKLLRVAGGLAGAVSCCCDTNVVCCDNVPASLNWIFSADAACDYDGCSGAANNEVTPAPGCVVSWLQGTLDDPSCVVAALRLCCDSESGYNVRVELGLTPDVVNIPMEVLSCNPLTLRGTVAVDISGCTANLTLDITEPP